jgi:hypothetical protein
VAHSSKYRSSGITELRVHGAGATPLAKLLDSDSSDRVAGDDIAGFYRVPIADRVTDSDDKRFPSHWVTEEGGEAVGDVEAYNWGKFTTGGGWQAGWVLLIPFAIINLAGWITPRKSWVGRALVRLIGLVTSIALVYWLAAITIGILGQCGPGSLCAERRWFLGFEDLPFFADRPGRLILIGIALSLLATFALWWWPGRRSADQYERYTPEEGRTSLAEAPADSRTEAGQLGQDAAKLWYSERDSRWLGAAHILAMLSTIAAGAVIAVGNTSSYSLLGTSVAVSVSFPDHLVPRIIVVLAGAALLYCAWFVWRLDPLEGTAPATPGFFRTSPYPAAWRAGLILIVSATGWVLFAPKRAETLDESGLDALTVGYEQFASSGFTLIGGAILILVGALLVNNIIYGRGGIKRLLAGLGPTFAGAAAIVVLAAMISGGVLWVADLFGQLDYQVPNVETLEALTADAEDARVDLAGIDYGDGIQPAELETIRGAIEKLGRLGDLERGLGDPLIRLNSLYYVVPFAFTILFLTMLFLALGLFFWAKNRIPSGRYRFDGLISKDRIDPDLVELVKSERRDDVAGIERMQDQIAGLLRKPFRNRRLHRLLILPLFVLAGFAALMLTPDAAVTIRGLGLALTVSIWVTVAIFLGLGASIRSSYAGGSSRGAMGGIWDIITFWPRFYHPFAPPSYGVRAVPELAQRIIELTKNADDHLIVSAHSQGVPLTIAALSLVPDVTLEKTALLTYGSPTGLLYGRFYPDYYSPSELQYIAQTRLKSTTDHVRWSNLWRLTDWTGGYALKIDANPPRKDFPEDIPDEYLAYLELFKKNQPPSLDGSEQLTDVVSEYRLTDPDPEEVRELSKVDPLPTPIGHGDYLHDRLYPSYRATLLKELVTAPTSIIIDLTEESELLRLMESVVEAAADAPKPPD